MSVADHPGRESRVAMRFALFAVLSVAIAVVVGPKGFPLLTGHFYERDLLAFVHLNTLGIIVAAIVGASYLILPRALGVPFPSGRASRASFWLHASGVLIFLIGFFQPWHAVLATGGMLVAGGLMFYSIDVWKSLRRSETRDIVSWHIGVSLFGLVGGFLLGFLLAGSKGTWFLGVKTMQVLSAHALLILAGWLVVMLNGVAYHQAQSASGNVRQPWRRVALLELGLISGGAWFGSTALLFTLGRTWVTLGAVAIAIGEALFLLQIVRLHIDPEEWRSASFTLLSSGAGLAASLLLAGGLLGDEPLISPYWVAAGWLAIGGMGLTAIQGWFPAILAQLGGASDVPESGFETVVSMSGLLAWVVAIGLSTWAIFDGNRDLASTAGFIGSFGLICFLGVAGHAALRSRPAPVTFFQGVAARLAGQR